MSKKNRHREEDDGDGGGGESCPHRRQMPDCTPFHDRTILSVIQSFPIGVKPDKINKWISAATARMVIDFGERQRRSGGLRYRLESTTITSIPSGKSDFSVQITMIALWLPMPRGWRPEADEEEEGPPWYPVKPSRN